VEIDDANQAGATAVDGGLASASFCVSSIFGVYKISQLYTKCLENDQAIATERAVNTDEMGTNGMENNQ